MHTVFDINQFPCGCLVTSPDCKILSANRYFLEQLNQDPKALTGRSINVLLNRASQLFCDSYIIPTLAHEGKCCEVQISLTSVDGDVVHKVASVRKMADGNLTWVFIEAQKRNALFNELETARLALQHQREELDELARTDALTGVANRRALDGAARRMFQDADISGQPVTVLMMDVDRFKHINDTYGHDVGDQALCALADALTMSVRKTDMVCRLGGDEFVCILRDTPLEHAKALCGRIHDAVATAMPDTCQFTISIGVAVHAPGDPADFHDILKRADRALYRAKDAGRANTQVELSSAA